MSDNVFAYTVPSGAWPQYVSVNARNGGIEVYVRGPAKHLGEWIECGPEAAITLTHKQAHELAIALKAYTDA